MSSANLSPDVPDDEQDFRLTMAELVRTAVENGIDVRGGWPVDNHDGPPDFEVVVHRLAVKE